MARLAPNDLRCEYLKNPLGMDVPKPRLSWKLASQDRSIRGEFQSAYQVQVASSRDALAASKPDLWDSGKVNSDQSHLIEYAGKPLASRALCWWRVRVWDGKGVPSAWSEPAKWSMGLLRPKDWQAKWIGLDGGEEIRPAWKDAKWIWASDSGSKAAHFRRTLSVPSNAVVIGAMISLISAGGFVLYVNGRQAAAGVGPATPENVARVDLREFLREGPNILAVAARAGTTQPSGFIGELRLDFEAGHSLVISSDASWSVATEVASGWESAATEGDGWSPAHEIGPHPAPPWPRLVEDERRLPARMLRKPFRLERGIKRATAYVSGMGLFEFYLNGRKVSDHVMDPLQTRFDKRTAYVTFDVTNRLRPGANAAGIILGNGRFYAPRLHVPVDTLSFGYPKLLFQMEIEYADGRTALVASDTSWKLTAEGPIRANNEFDGEEYDARQEMAGWSAPGFDDSKWQAAQDVAAPGGVLIAQMLEPQRVTETLPARDVTVLKPGVYMVDFGQSFYGMVRLRVRGPAGARVQLRTAFTKKADGSLKMENNRSARSTDVYILKGEGEEIWAPRFRGQGFRYAEVTGFPGVPTVRNFEGLVVHTDMETRGEVVTSSELLNRIYQNVRWSVRMQNRGVPLDPDRDERQAWLGTSIKSSESEAWMYQVAPFYRNFLAETRSDQRNDGNLSDGGSIWPFYSGDPIWPSVVTIVPEWFHDFYGDTRILEENFETMKRWMQFQERTNLLEDFTLRRAVYGDWVDASSMDQPLGPATSGATSRELMATAFFYRNCRVLERVARLLGREDDRQYYDALSENVKAGLNRRFFRPDSGKYESETQASYVFPLAFGMVPDAARAKVIENLVEDIMVRHRGHLSVGFVGMQYLMQTLTDIGHPEVAYTIATQTTRPSWGYMISKGATSIWEHWDTDTQEPGMNGESQCILSGNLAAWFYQTLAGINYDPDHPGFQHIILWPRPVGDLKSVRAWHESPYGRIQSDWRIESDTLHWQFTVPPNAQATVVIPADANRVREKGKPFSKAEGVRLVRSEARTSVFEVGSGEYSISAPWAAEN